MSEESQDFDYQILKKNIEQRDEQDE